MSYDDRGWEDLGDTIERIIDRAVSSQDFQRLNQTITQAVNQAVNTGGDAMRRAAGDAARHIQQARAQRGYQTNKNIYSSRLEPIHSGGSSVPAQRQNNNLPILYSSTSGKMALGITKTVGGALLGAGGALDLISTSLVRLFTHTGFWSFSTVFASLLTVGGILLLKNGLDSIGMVSRFQKYVNALGQKTHCEIQQLARIVGKPAKFVRKELQKQIDRGYFLEGHLDDDGTSLITSEDTYQHYRQAMLQQQAQEQRKALEEKKREAEAAATPAPKAPDPQVQEVLSRGNAFIAQIRRCNDAIPGEEISGKISRMETIIQKIFDRARSHPEIVPDLKKLMDYYLPMTVKLLNAYAEMDAQPIQGETILASKKEIEATLDTLNNAFEKLLDSIFKETAMDISSDISVLQTLLAQEGLTDDELFGSKK